MNRCCFSLSAALASLLYSASAGAAVIDTFSDASLAEYTLTRVLDNGVAESNVSFSSPSGSLQAAYGGTVNQPEQVLLLRNDFALSVGETLTADASFAVNISTMDFGIAISATGSPTGVGNPTPTDTRSATDWLAVYIRPSQDAVRVTSSISGVVTTGTGVLTVAETNISKLFITRTSATNFAVGYYDLANVPVTSTTVNFGAASTIGAAVGFYADLRAVGGSLGNLDNLQIVPEASTAVLGLLGMAGLMRRRR